ncbi:SAV_915 family protein [Streptomyces sp. VRA16 Mangrove soil]|uniref:SAV_915 family protein n=1 Tax=Streptomyces sp. VRA16 Mangrove soil TaxID=2817434 RepID=UPI001E41C253|nr:SAV_915 family protein [Streptomyces sp. VRA16 Mangrove soil]
METSYGEPSAPRRSRLFDYVDEGLPARPLDDRAPGPKPGVPAYPTPVFVPAHPRVVDATDGDGRAVRVPFIAYELFEHPTDGTVALAFTSLGRLVAVLGEAQPWAATSLGPLAEVMAEHEVTVRLDPVALTGAPHWQPASLAAYAEEMR